MSQQLKSATDTQMKQKLHQYDPLDPANLLIFMNISSTKPILQNESTNIHNHHRLTFLVSTRVLGTKEQKPKYFSYRFLRW